MNEIDKTIIEKLASRVAELGGRAYMVGGAVRDEIMKRPIKDVDIEVHGISEEVLEAVLKELGKPIRFVYRNQGSSTEARFHYECASQGYSEW